MSISHHSWSFTVYTLYLLIYSPGLAFAADNQAHRKKLDSHDDQANDPSTSAPLINDSPQASSDSKKGDVPHTTIATCNSWVPRTAKQIGVDDKIYPGGCDRSYGNLGTTALSRSRHLTARHQSVQEQREPLMSSTAKCHCRCHRRVENHRDGHQSKVDRIASQEEDPSLASASEVAQLSKEPCAENVTDERRAHEQGRLWDVRRGGYQEEGGRPCLVRGEREVVEVRPGVEQSGKLVQLREGSG